ncbi:MAG TPA: hypothetical protein VGO50_14195 [Pyrinomonadaceae bacterium]|jgi:hypothetical protein|nr:hypothetical protein [Pyrinomonadaceae bacterium]
MNTPRLFIFLLLIFLPVSGVFAQTKIDPKYGKPVAQIFEVRPEIAAEVSFAKTGEVCDVLIVSHPVLFGRVLPGDDAEPIKDDVMDEILAELAPLETRGYFVIGTYRSGLLERYRNVTIYRARGDKDTWKYAQITWQITPCGRASNEPLKLKISK